MNLAYSPLRPMEPIADLSIIQKSTSFDSALQRSPEAAIVNEAHRCKPSIQTAGGLQRQKPRPSLATTRGCAISYSSNQVARQLQGVLEEVAKQAGGVAKQAEEHLRALSPVSVPNSAPTQDDAPVPPEQTNESGNKTGDGVATVMAEQREETLFSLLNDYMSNLANDVGLLGNYFTDNVIDPSRTISESFSLRDDDVNGMLQVLGSQLHPHGVVDDKDDPIHRSFTL